MSTVLISKPSGFFPEATATLNVDQLLDQVDALPPSPYPVPELFKALSDPEFDVSRVAEIITYDAALTTRLLRLCNSAYFSRGQPANTVAEAISRLGFQTVYRVVAVLKGPQIFQPGGRSFGYRGEEMWRHSVMSALYAQSMAEDFGADSGMLFTAGLLHDLGKVVMGMSFQEKYDRLVSQARAEGRRLWEAERAAFGTDHAALGARLLERWRFSPELVTCVRYHHQPKQAPSLARLVAMVQVGSALSNVASCLRSDRQLAEDTVDSLEVLGWSAEALSPYRHQMEQHKQTIQTLMRMGR